MITEDYVSFETAKLLKKKGFDGQCHMSIGKNEQGELLAKGTEWDDSFILCPTLQMAMKWLREAKHWYIQVSIQNNGTYIGYIYRTDGFPYVGWDKRRVKETPEEAAEAAIKYCLEKLI